MSHIFVLTTILKNRIAHNLDPFAVFIDFKKAFDFVDRSLLLYKLCQAGISRKFYFAIKSMFHNNQCCVRVGEQYFTDWFSTSKGVRQGDIISPSLFLLFIDDLIHEIDQLG